jgi:hypothetical protein
MALPPLSQRPESDAISRLQMQLAEVGLGHARARNLSREALERCAELELLTKVFPESERTRAPRLAISETRPSAAS